MLFGVEKTGKVKEEIEKVLKKYNAFWRYSGKEREPHALLTSGLHSDGYFDFPYLFFQEPRIVPELAQLLVKKLQKEVDLSPVTVVVSSAMAAILLGYEVAKVLGRKFAYCEKEQGKQVLKRFDPQPDEKILQIEELITTLKTTKQVTEAIRGKNPEVEFLRDSQEK
jgi:orotate phosphoribosyltransferase